MNLISVAFEHDMAFSATVRGHRVSMDFPGHPGFTYAGPSPVELLVMAIGGCIGVHVALFCEQAGLSSAGLRVDLSFTLAQQNDRKRVSSVYAEVEAPGIPAELAAQAEQAARRCILSNSFARAPDLDIVLRSGPGQREAA
ncbi:MAG: OsmC family protein [candidate division NC10 bacterium]|nr:OsmC family protein [candidate division NC10 bacterium]